MQTVLIRVKFELQPSTSGLSFHGPYVHTKNQVRCIPSPMCIQY